MTVEYYNYCISGEFFSIFCVKVCWCCCCYQTVKSEEWKRFAIRDVTDNIKFPFIYCDQMITRTWVIPKTCHTTRSWLTRGRSLRVHNGNPSTRGFWFGKSPLDDEIREKVDIIRSGSNFRRLGFTSCRWTHCLASLSWYSKTCVNWNTVHKMMGNLLPRVTFWRMKGSHP